MYGRCLEIDSPCLHNLETCRNLHRQERKEWRPPISKYEMPYPRPRAYLLQNESACTPWTGVRTRNAPSPLRSVRLLCTFQPLPASTPLMGFSCPSLRQGEQFDPRNSLKSREYPQSMIRGLLLLN